MQIKTGKTFLEHQPIGFRGDLTLEQKRELFRETVSDARTLLDCIDQSLRRLETLEVSKSPLDLAILQAFAGSLLDTSVLGRQLYEEALNSNLPPEV